ncbi:MAG: hypothetical protein HZC42_12640 [Candidatus Eisenbacteria bacterium]|nr:hypothetical protein [Candidatus Eisenbacteria bacterium]
MASALAIPPSSLVVEACALGVLLGLFGAWRNRVRFVDEALVWAAGGAFGAAVALAAGAALAPRLGAAPAAGSTLALVLWGAGSLLASSLTPALDRAGRIAPSLGSFALKWLQSPFFTSAGLLAALLLSTWGRHARLARGTLFIEVGRGAAALTLGAVIWTRGGLFDDRGRVPDVWVRHEALHARTVAALGEWGFYPTYVIVGAAMALARRGPWNAVTTAGRGNPFEKTAYAEHRGWQRRRSSGTAG